MPLIPKTQAFFFSSNVLAGATQVSAGGDRFAVQLDTPLHIPSDAVGVSLSVTQASIWNNAFNVSAEIGNNTFAYQYLGNPFSAVIPDGQYNVSDLENFFERTLSSNGHDSLGVQLSAELATQKIILVIKPDFAVDFTLGTIRFLLGFDPAVLSAGTFVGNNVAEFDRVNLYQIKSNILSVGIPVNSLSNGIIASVPISVAPGSLINYSPQNPIEIDASELVGHNKSFLEFQLLDQAERATPTNGETYSFVVRIKYFIPHDVIKSDP
jgi:hypothetical protein